MSIFNAYLSALRSRPLLTKSVTGGVLFAIGDSANQCYHHEKKYDVKGAAIFTGFGTLLYAPTNHFWFGWMETNIACGLSWSKKPLTQALARVVFHSCTYAPFSIISLFLWSGYLSGQPMDSIVELIAPSAMTHIWLTGSVFWIPTMLGIYRFVPLHLRVLATSLANVFWTTYLSFKKTESLKIDRAGNSNII
ncbi:unnamed protein product [Ectocarpus fasciculatus]